MMMLICPCRILRRLALLLLAVVAWLAWLPAYAAGEKTADRVPAAPDPVVQLNSAQAVVFSNALDVLARAGRVAFVAEGTPLTLRLSDNQLKALALPEKGAPLAILVEHVAAAYDYDVERRGSVFLLRKRYSDPRDLPSVTVEEGVEAARDVSRLLDRFNPKVIQAVPPGQPNGLYGELMLSLTDEQLQHMGLDNNSFSSRIPLAAALPIAALSPRQRELAWRFALYFHVQVLADDVENARDELRRFQVPSTVFCWNVVSSDPFWRAGLRAFGYEFVSEREENKPRFWPLGGSDVGMGLRAGGSRLGEWRSFRAVARVSRPGGEPFPDTTAPDLAAPSSAGEAPSVPPAQAAPNTLSAVAEAFMTAGTGAPAAAEAVVDEALQAKAITVTGTQYVPAEDLLRAMAAVYGLRVRTQEDGALRLSRHTARPAARLSDLPATLERALPEPLVRALRGPARESETVRFENIKALPGESAEALNERWNEAMRQDSKTWNEARERPSRMRAEAIRRLRTTVEPKLRAAPNGRVPVLALDETERQALAVATLAECVRALDTFLMKPVPDYLVHFDAAFLVGGLSERDGKTWFSLALAVSNPDGKTVSFTGGGAIGSAPYPK